MPFRPKNNDHAVIEVVFGIQMSRPLQPAAIEDFAKAGDRWPELPRISRTSPLHAIFKDVPLPEGALPPALLGGVSFDRVKPDGQPEWRLRADGARFLVNCLDYTRWSAIWPRALKYLMDATEAAPDPDNLISGLLLQYVDVFDWDGPVEDYSVRELLNEDSPFVAPAVLDRGPSWHLHAGWYRTDEIPVAGRLLERIHADAGMSGGTQPTVKIDSYLQMEFAEPITRDQLFGAKPIAETAFRYLHDLDKDLFRSYLTKLIRERIHLDG